SGLVIGVIPASPAENALHAFPDPFESLLRPHVHGPGPGGPDTLGQLGGVRLVVGLDLAEALAVQGQDQPLNHGRCYSRLAAVGRGSTRSSIERDPAGRYRVRTSLHAHASC